MILRKPNFQDIYKASEFLSQDDNEKKYILLAWLEQSKNPAFFSWVIVKEHDVRAVITGQQENGMVLIGKLAGSENHQEMLLNKMIRTFNPQQINITVPEVTPVLLKFGFDVETYNVTYRKSNEEIEDITVEETVEDNTSQ